jgi:hypothetical protein
MKYKEAPKEEAPRKKIETVKDFLQDMADAGFTGTFKALNNDGSLFKGYLIEEGEKVVIKAKKVPQQEEARKRILEKLKTG